MSYHFKMKQGIILLAEDSSTDQFIFKKALEKSKCFNGLYMVSNSFDALEYLGRSGKFTDPQTSPKPNLMLLDSQIPGISVIKLLKVIKRDPIVRSIPVVVWGTSLSQGDENEFYCLGAIGIVTKPEHCDQYIDTVHALEQIWLSKAKQELNKQMSGQKCPTRFINRLKEGFEYIWPEGRGTPKNANGVTR